MVAVKIKEISKEGKQERNRLRSCYQGSVTLRKRGCEAGRPVVDARGIASMSQQVTFTSCNRADHLSRRLGHPGGQGTPVSVVCILLVGAWGSPE